MNRLLLVIVLGGCRGTSTAPPAPAVAPEAAPATRVEGESAVSADASPAASADPGPSAQDPDDAPKPDPAAAPSSADPEVFSLVISTKLIRISPFVDGTRRLFDAVPDVVFLRGSANVIDDVDYVTYSSTDLSNVVASTVVVKHRLQPKKVRAAVEAAFAARGETVIWSEKNGLAIGDPHPKDDDWDPRLIVLVDKHFAAYVHPALTSTIDRHVDAIRDFSKKHKLRSLQMSGRIPELKQTPPFPPPQSYALTINAAKNPTTRVTLAFGTSDEAEVFVKFWRGELKAVIDNSTTLKLAVAPLYDAVVPETKGETVKLTAKLSTTQATLILDLMARQLEVIYKRASSRRAGD